MPVDITEEQDINVTIEGGVTVDAGRVKATNLDVNPDYLNNKLTSDGTIVLSPVFVGVNQEIQLSTTKSLLGLGNVDNTSDLNKPISTATQTALDTKVDKVSGKGLSTNDYTDADKNRLANTSGTNTGDQDLSGLVPKTTTVNGHALNANVTVSKSDVGLGNVVNVDTTTTANITDSTNKKFITEVEKVNLDNTSGVNTGDETNSSIKTKLGSASSSNDGYLNHSDWSTFNSKGSSNVENFTDLSDAPISYSGQGGKAVYVKGDETGLQFQTAVSTDEKVKVSATDTTTGYLGNKLVAGTNITITKENSGANEDLLISASGGGSSDHASLTHLNWADAGHIFDTNLDIGNYNFVTGGELVLSNNQTNLSTQMPGWSYAKKIILPLSNSDLTNYPVLIYFNDADINSHAKANGFDIRFLDSNFNVLNYERLSYASGVGWFYVKVPTVSSSVQTQLYIVYGNSSATDGDNYTQVYDSDTLVQYNYGGCNGSTTFAGATAQSKRDSAHGQNMVDFSGITAQGMNLANLGFNSRGSLRGYGSPAWAKFPTTNLPTGNSARTYEFFDYSTTIVDSSLFSHGTNSNTPVYIQGVAPNLISGLLRWYKADSETYNDGDLVGTATDQSGNSSNATSSGAARPTFKTNIINGLPVYRFAGSQYLTNSAGYKQIFVVANWTTGSGSTWGVTDATITNTSNNSLHTGGTGQNYLLEFGSGSQWDNIYINNTVGTSLGHSSSFAPMATPKILCAGWSGTANSSTNWFSGWYGDCAEIIAFNRLLTTVERKQVMAYLKVKYNISAYSDELDYGTSGQAMNIMKNSFDVGTGITYTYGGTELNSNNRYKAITYDGNILRATVDGLTFNTFWNLTLSTNASPPPSIGDTYTNNGITFTVIFSGSGLIVFSTTSLSSPSGNTFTRVTGSGASTLTGTASNSTTLNTTNGSYAYLGSTIANPTTGLVYSQNELIRISDNVRSNAFLRFTALNQYISNTFNAERTYLGNNSWITEQNGNLEIAYENTVYKTFDGTTETTNVPTAFVGNQTVTGNETVSGTVQGAHLKDTSLATDYLTTTSSGQLVNSNISKSGTTWSFGGSNISAAEVHSSALYDGNSSTNVPYFDGSHKLVSNDNNLNYDSTNKRLKIIAPNALSNTNKFQVMGGDTISNPTSTSGSINYFSLPSDPPWAITPSVNYYPKPAEPTGTFTADIFYPSGGYQALSYTHNYRLYYFKSTGIGNIYSSTYLTATATDDSSTNYYYVSLAWDTLPSGVDGVLILKNDGDNGWTGWTHYISTGYTQVNDDSDMSWSDGFTFPDRSNYYSNGDTTHTYRQYNTSNSGGRNFFSSNYTEGSVTTVHSGSLSNPVGNVSGISINPTYYTDGSGTYTASGLSWDVKMKGHYNDGTYDWYSPTLAEQTFTDDNSNGSGTDNPTDNSSYIDYKTDGSGAFTASGNSRTYDVWSVASIHGQSVYSGTNAVITLTDDNSNGKTQDYPTSLSMAENSSGTSAWTASTNIDGMVWAYKTVHGQRVYSTGQPFTTVVIGTDYDGVDLAWAISSTGDEEGYVIYLTDGSNSGYEDVGLSYSKSYDAAPSGSIDTSVIASTITYNNVVQWNSSASNWLIRYNDGSYDYEQGTSSPTLTDTNTGWTQQTTDTSLTAATITYNLNTTWSDASSSSDEIVYVNSSSSFGEYYLDVSSGVQSQDLNSNSGWTSGSPTWTNPPAPYPYGYYASIFVNTDMSSGRVLKQDSETGHNFDYYYDGSDFTDTKNIWTSGNATNPSYYTASGQTIEITPYSKALIGATNIYSTAGSSASVTDANNDGSPFYVDWSWGSISGATGYRVLLTGGNGQDVGLNYFSDFGDNWSGSTNVLPNAAPSPLYVDENQILGCDTESSGGGSIAKWIKFVSGGTVYNLPLYG